MPFEVAPLDMYAQRVTTGVAYIGGLLMLPLLFAYLANIRWAGLAVPSLFALPLAVFLLLCYGQQPVSYQISENGLTVRRRWWRALRVPLDAISGVSLAPVLADVPRRGLRFAFNAGIFGYQGPFQLAPYGSAFFLATNRELLVAVARRNTAPLIISPATPRPFIEALNDLRGQGAIQMLGTDEK
jgi:hypothetical protein